MYKIVSRFLAVAVVLGCSLSLALTSGCGKKSEPGGKAGANNQFTIKVNPGSTSIKQGGKEEVTISVSRGKDFKEPIDLKIETPAGLKVDNGSSKIGADTTETKVWLEAEPTAKVGEHTVTIVGTPPAGKGEKTSVALTATVKEK